MEKLYFIFKKETEKIVLLPVTDLIQIIATKHLFEGHGILSTKYCVYSQKERNESYGSLKENKLACFTNNKGSFQVIDLVRDF